MNASKVFSCRGFLFLYIIFVTIYFIFIYFVIDEQLLLMRLVPSVEIIV